VKISKRSTCTRLGNHVLERFRVPCSGRHTGIGGGGRISSSSYLYGMALFRLLGVSEAQARDPIPVLRPTACCRPVPLSRRCAPGLGGSLLAAV
jgi:hypothetical protein